MAESASASTYNEPTVMWRMRRDRLVSHAVIAPAGNGASVMWFVNCRLLGFREFSNYADAIRWSDRMRDHNWATGWRFAAPDAP